MSVTIAIRKDRLLLIVVAVAVIAVVALNAYAFLRPEGAGSVENTAENFNKLKAAENPTDKCTAPEGYTQEEWEQHMSHHPELYPECF